MGQAKLACVGHGILRKGNRLMLDQVARADDVLIDKVCQPLVDWIDQAAELDCFKVARVCTDLSALAWILSQASVTAAAVGTGNLGFEFFQCALILLGLGSIIVLRTIFERVGGSRGGSQANPLRASMFTHRVMCLLWLIGMLIKTAMTPVGFEPLALFAVGAFATLGVYAGACSNRPPKRHEQRESLWSSRTAEVRSR